MITYVPECNRRGFNNRATKKKEWIERKLKEWNEQPNICRMAHHDPQAYFKYADEKKRALEAKYDSFTPTPSRQTKREKKLWKRWRNSKPTWA